MRKLTAFALLTLASSAPLMAQYSQPVRDVDNPARTPYRSMRDGTIDLNFVNKWYSAASFPAGQRLVVEQVSITCTMDADDNVASATISISRPSGGGMYVTDYVPILVPKQGTTWNGKSVWTVSQSVRLYTDAGHAPDVGIHHSKTTSTPYCAVYVSGYTFATP